MATANSPNSSNPFGSNPAFSSGSGGDPFGGGGQGIPFPFSLMAQDGSAAGSQERPSFLSERDMNFFATVFGGGDGDAAPVTLPGGNSGGSLPQRSPFDRLSVVLGDRSPFELADLPTGDNPFAGRGSGSELPYGGNPFAGDNLFTLFGGGNNPLRTGQPSGGNPFSGSSPNFSVLAAPGNASTGGGSNPSIPDGLLQQSPFAPLQEVQELINASPSIDPDNPPIGNGNRDEGNRNATIGNGNQAIGDENATIGNGNWLFGDQNATIGNGNWGFSGDNVTLGNGNWYWDYGRSNTTLGNGNWHFGSDNATIGNGNWNFGNNNTIIGNGNWVFTSGNTVVGNGNWLLDAETRSLSVEDLLNGLAGSETSSEPSPLGFAVDELVNTLIGRVGSDFEILTGDLDADGSQTLEQLILSQSADAKGDLLADSPELEQLFAVLGDLPANGGTTFGNGTFPSKGPGQTPEAVPEPTATASLVVLGVGYLLWQGYKRGLYAMGGKIQARSGRPLSDPIGMRE